MKKLLLFVLSLLFTWQVNAQNSDADKLIDQGVALHDHGLHEDALRKYTQAIAMDKHNLRAKYEMAYTYLTLKNWDEAIYYSYEVVDEKADYYLDACMIYGAALDNSGRAKIAIRFYNKILKNYPEEHLLYYNLGLTYYRDQQTDEALKCIQKAIQLNKSHMSSHYLLSEIMQEKGERLKSMLPLYYLLLFEQDSERSIEAHTQLQNLWTMAAINDGNSITVSIGNGLANTGMASIEIGVGAIAAAYIVDEQKKQMEQPEKLAHQTRDLFTLMEEIEVKELDFFAITYVDFFNLMTKNGHADVFGYYINNCVYKEKILAWLTGNNSNFSNFMEWMELQQ